MCALRLCARRQPAPVEDRARAARTAPRPHRPRRAAARRCDAGSAARAPKNAGKPGYYTVKPGDTLIRIGLENGQNWRDIARWNNIDNPNVIEVGQVLRVIAARHRSRRRRDARRCRRKGRNAAARQRPAPAARSGAAPRRRRGARVDPRRRRRAAAAAAAAPPAAAAVARDADDDMNWVWPATGPVAATFDEARNKGLVITRQGRRSGARRG